MSPEGNISPGRSRRAGSTLASGVVGREGARDDYPGFGGLRVGEADAVVLNVTAAGATAWSYLSVFPSHLCSLPNVSNLNFTAGPPVPNQVITRLAGNEGCAESDEVETIVVDNSDGTVHVIVDVFGIFTAPTTTLFD